MNTNCKMLMLVVSFIHILVIFFLWYNVFESINDGCTISFYNNNASGPSHLEGMSLLVLVDGGEDGLVDAEAHGGGDQRKGEVSDHAEGTFVEKDVQK